MLKVEEKWNEIVRAMLRMEKTWEQMQAALGKVKNSEDLTLPGQRIFAMSSLRGKLSTALPRLRDHAIRSGGWEALLIPEPEEETSNKEKEDE